MTDLNPGLLRVDVAGYACYVRGEEARRHLEQVNGELARMKMALYRILRVSDDEAVKVFARIGLASD